MQNDAIETLLLRHYGNNAAVPEQLEQQLLASLHQEAHQMQQQRLHERQISRRQAMRLVAIGSAGIGLLSAGLEGLQQIEAAVLGQETSQPTFS
jgi:dihydroxyacetone kinase